MKGTKIKKYLIWFLKSYLWLIPLLFIIDVISKLGMERLLNKHGGSITVIPGFFSFTLVYNTGAAWGIFAGKDWLLVTISLIAGIALSAFLFWRYKSLSFLSRLSIILLIPGAFGNLIDRAFYPHGVIDFLQFTFIDFPVFNLADAFLVIGVVILLIELLISEISDRRSKKKVKSELSEDKIKKGLEETKEEMDKLETTREEKSESGTDDSSTK